MSFSLEAHPDLPAITITLHANFDAKVDTPQIAHRFVQEMAAFDSEIFLICDFRAAINRADMESIIAGSFLATQAENPLFHHPQVREIIFVAVTELMRFVVDGLRTPTYGSLNVTLVSSVEDALALVRSRLT